MNKAIDKIEEFRRPEYSERIVGVFNHILDVQEALRLKINEIIDEIDNTKEKDS